MVSLLVVGDEGKVPEVVDTHGAEQDVGVVSLVVMADPGSDESPEGLDSWVSPKSRHFLWLSSCKVHQESKNNLIWYLPSTGLFQRFLGASLAVKGV